MGDAVQEYVDKEEKEAILELVKYQLEKTQVPIICIPTNHRSCKYQGNFAVSPTNYHPPKVNRKRDKMAHILICCRIKSWGSMFLNKQNFIVSWGQNFVDS